MIRHKRARKSSFSLNPLIPWNLHSPTSPPVPFTFPSGGWHADSALYYPYHSCDMAGCVYIGVCVCVPGRGFPDRDGEADQQCHERCCLWLIGARVAACSVVLTGSGDGGTTRSAAEIAGSECRAMLPLFWTHQCLETAYLLSWSGVHRGKVWWSLNFDLFFARPCLWVHKQFQPGFGKSYRPTNSIRYHISYFLISKVTKAMKKI